MNNEFKWDDALVSEYVSNVLTGTLGFEYDHMGKFKKSKQPPVKEQPSFEILYYTDPHVISDIKDANIIKPNNYAILRDYPIYSIRRNSDGEVFKCGEKFLADAGCELTIKSFEIVDNKVKVWSEEYGFWYLRNIKPIKKPLFTTEDGIDIFGGEYLHVVCDDWNILSDDCNNKFEADLWLLSNRKIFFKKENAEEYVSLNKPKQPVFTCNGVDYFVGDECFYVTNDFFIKENIVDESYSAYRGVDLKVFQTKQLAEDYVMLNKPVLVSFNELSKHSGNTNFYSKFFIEFFRSKTLG